MTGKIMEAEIVFYPSAYEQRALIKSAQPTTQTSFTEPEGLQTIAQVLEKISDALSQHPFLEKIPFVLSNFKLAKQDNSFFLVDASSKAVALDNLEMHYWTILSITKGKAFDCFALYENEKLTIHSLWFNHDFYSIL